MGSSPHASQNRLLALGLRALAFFGVWDALGSLFLGFKVLVLGVRVFVGYLALRFCPFCVGSGREQR